MQSMYSLDPVDWANMARVDDHDNLYESIQFYSCHRLRKHVGYIFLFQRILKGWSLYFLTYKLNFYFNVLIFDGWLGFLRKQLIIIINGYVFEGLKFCYWASWLAIAINFATHVDKATAFCFFDFHEII